MYHDPNEGWHTCKVCQGHGTVYGFKGAKTIYDGKGDYDFDWQYGYIDCTNPKCFSGVIYVDPEITKEKEQGLDLNDLTFDNPNRPLLGATTGCDTCVSGFVVFDKGDFSIKEPCSDPRCFGGRVQVSRATIERLLAEKCAAEIRVEGPATFKLGEVSGGVLQRAKEIAIQHREARRSVCCTG